MTLHRDRHRKIRSRCRIQSFHDLPRQYIIITPAIWTIRQSIHIFHRTKCVKSNVRKNCIATIKRRFIVMHSMRRISQLFQVCTDTFRHLAFEHCFIWVFTHPKIVLTHSCKYFKLRIYRTGTNRRHRN